MVHLNKLTLTTIASLCLAAALPASEASAQQRLVFKVAAENTKYTQQHEIDVGDVSGHQVRLFEIHRTYPSDPPRDRRDEDRGILDPRHLGLHQQ